MEAVSAQEEEANDEGKEEEVPLEEVLQQNKPMVAESSPKDEWLPNFSLDTSAGPDTQLVPYEVPRSNPYVAAFRPSRRSHPAYTVAAQPLDFHVPHTKNNVYRKPIAHSPRDKDLYDDVINLLNRVPQDQTSPSANSILVARFLICLGMLIAYPIAGTLLFVIFFGLELYLSQDPHHTP
ncbi:hypothetical protein TRICI_002917 [Trichomonascus ciferrii]|uniref:Uncharacterized protein n=1 Tax=Trichomonascus ciferrii TaxID=44093 RepID=A0A642V5A9_9ASCO|nr:hypothetical protein TRICI_002917 [Trichomonascus ciferrii]